VAGAEGSLDTSGRLKRIYPTPADVPDYSYRQPASLKLAAAALLRARRAWTRTGLRHAVVAIAAIAGSPRSGIGEVWRPAPVGT
jgi:hypothetical protein